MVVAPLEMLLRMGVGVVLGSAIGYERERSGRPAGLRTHLLVSLASATFMLVSNQFVYFQHYEKDDLIAVDTSRIAAAVVTGVGFLGGGAILRSGINVHGLTTAASLWLVAAVGLAAGGGMFIVAAAATVISLFCLTVLRRIEQKDSQPIQCHLAITADAGTVQRPEIMEELRKFEATVIDVNYDRVLEGNRFRLKLNVRVPTEQNLEDMLRRLEALPGVHRVKVRRPSP